MQSIPFRALPLSVRLMTAAAMMLTWVFLEEHVIEPFRLYDYMPFYRVGSFCPYDAAALLLVLVSWFWAHRKQS
jgi:hypothetical protein